MTGTMHERTDEPTMNAQPTNAGRDHLSPDLLASYFTQGLSEDDRLGVEEHLADCDTCIEAGRTAFSASGLIDSWTPEIHGEAALQAVLSQALATTRTLPSLSAWANRLARWTEQWAGRAEATVRVVLEAPAQSAKILTEGMQDLARPGAAWQFAPAPSAMPVRGPAPSAARRLAASQPVIVTAGGDGVPNARLAVSGERGEVVVRLDDLPAGVEPPLVLLVSADGSGEPRLALPERAPDGAAWIARFEGLGPGDYLVAFEPLA